MIGPRLRQAVALVLALAFAPGVTGEAYGFHGCPRHGGPGSAGDPPPAPHRDGPPRALDASDGGGDSPGSSLCLCVGSCHSGAATVLASGTSAAPPAPARRPDLVPRAGRGVPPHVTPAYFLPYSLGPPAA